MHDKKSAGENLSDSTQLGVDLLISDAKTALTFLDLAETTSDSDNRSRRIAEAHHAYRTILAFLPRLQPSAEELQILTNDLQRLAERLNAAGVSVESDQQ